MIQKLFQNPKIIIGFQSFSLSLLNAFLMTFALNFLHLPLFLSDFYPFFILSIFIFFQFNLILPLKIPTSINYNLRKLLKKIWPLILEFGVELLLIINFYNLINHTGFSSFPSYVSSDHLKTFFLHAVLLFPFYYYCLLQYRSNGNKIIEKNALSKKWDRYFPYLFIFVNFVLMTILDIHWEILGFLFGFLNLSIIIYIKILKKSHPNHVFHLKNSAILFLLNILWDLLLCIAIANLTKFHFIADIQNGIYYQILNSPIRKVILLFICSVFSLSGFFILFYIFQQIFETNCFISFSDYQKDLRFRISNYPKRQKIKNYNSFEYLSDFQCLSCSHPIDLNVLSELSKENSIFCENCGEKIHFQEIFPLPKEQIISDHQEILRRMKESKEKLSNNLDKS